MSVADSYTPKPLPSVGGTVDNRKSTLAVSRVQRSVTQFALRNRVCLLALGHAVVFATAFWISFLLRFDGNIPAHLHYLFWASLPAVLSIKLYTYYATGHFHGWWRYVTFSDLVALFRASLISLITLVVLNHYALNGKLPRVVVIIDCLVTVLMLGALRASWRMCREQFWFQGGRARIALMFGADHDNGVLAHQIHSNRQLPYRVVGFIDDDLRRRGTRLGGIPVYGDSRDLSEIATRVKATDVLVVADELPGAELRDLMDRCDRAQLTLKMVPSVVNQFRGNRLPVRDVEINDLLGRDPVKLDLDSISKDVRGKSVLVTGAGGSIGSEICRQLLPFNPARIVLLDNSENAVFLINNELDRRCGETLLSPVVANVLDDDRMRHVFSEFEPDFVLHAAAHKHVGLMELNVGQCVRNNLFGTRCVALLADEFDCEKFVLISTDKAVNPTSVMGATKQLAERFIHAMAQESSTAFIVVRFGNVLGSNGSVVPIFKEQIRMGGPVTVTDDRMTRFFMTIPEASQLVLQAASMGRGGEIFVLEMGEQVRIVDLARDLIRLSGFSASEIPIKVIGTRPGEKLYEELYFDDERSLDTSHPKLRAAYHRPYRMDEVNDALDELQALLDAPNGVVRTKLKQIVHEYAPTPGTGSFEGQGASESEEMNLITLQPAPSRSKDQVTGLE